MNLIDQSECLRDENVMQLNLIVYVLKSYSSFYQESLTWTNI